MSIYEAVALTLAIIISLTLWRLVSRPCWVVADVESGFTYSWHWTRTGADISALLINREALAVDGEPFAVVTRDGEVER